MLGRKFQKGDLTAEGSHNPVGFFVGPDGVHSVLVGRLELGFRLGLALEIHLPEHVQSRLLASTHGFSSLVLQRAGKLPSILIAAETEGLTVLDTVSTSRRCILERNDLHVQLQ